MNAPEQVYLTERQVAKAATLADRLRLAMGPAGLKNPNQLALAVGVKRQTAYYWLDGTTKSIDSPTLKKLGDVLGVRDEWLMTGDLPIYAVTVPTDDEMQIIGFYRRMTAEDQAVFMKMARSLAGDSPNPPSRDDPFPRVKRR